MSGNDQDKGGETEQQKDVIVLEDYRALKAQEKRRVLCNYCEKFPRAAQDVKTDYDEAYPGWPKKVGDIPFVIEKDKILWLAKPDDFYAWLNSRGTIVDWGDSVRGAITKREFFAYIRQDAESFAEIEELPHYPPKDHIYYHLTLKSPENPDGSKLEGLLNFFNPASTFDKDLLRAAFLTLFWGGPGGARPAFVLTGLDDDPQGGRGIGKTMVTTIMGGLAGGLIDADMAQSGEDIKKRILTAGHARLIRFDNVKSDRLSSADIEALITTEYISGHRLYKGHAKRENNLTYVFTFNDVSFSQDMAQRAIPIRLARSAFSPQWHDDLLSFLRSNKDAIIADILARLTAPGIALDGEIRFAGWGSQVLSHATTQTAIFAHIDQAQATVNADEICASRIQDGIAERLQTYFVSHYQGKAPADPYKMPFCISKALLHKWAVDILGVLHLSNFKISRMIHRLHLPMIQGSYDYKHYSFYLWWMPESVFQNPEDDSMPLSCWLVRQDSPTFHPLGAVKLRARGKWARGGLPE